jgi:transcriptional regulator with XRE-family HTH domain
MRVKAIDRNILLISIALEVKCRRQSQELTPIELAGKAGMHPNVIGRLERAIYNPTVLVLGSIAKALNASMVELLSGTSK